MVVDKGTVKFSTSGTLFKSNGKEFTSAGNVDVTLTKLSHALRLQCCPAGKRVLCYTNLGAGALSVQSDTYVSFRADDGIQYSLHCNNAEHICIIAMYEAIAAATASGSALSATTVDVTKGQGLNEVCVHDAIGVRHALYAMSEGKLGRVLDSNITSKRTYKFPAPSSNMALEPGMKGFEGLVVGMRQGGRRVAVIPPAARSKVQGVNEGETLVVFVEALKLRAHDDPSKSMSMLSISGASRANLAASGLMERAESEMSPDNASNAGLPDKSQLMVMSTQHSAPPPPPSLPVSQMKSIRDTDANVVDLLKATDSLATSVGQLSQQVSTVHKDVKQLHPARDLHITTWEAMHNLQTLLTDTGRLQDALLMKDATIRGLQARVRHHEPNAEFPESQAGQNGEGGAHLYAGAADRLTTREPTNAGPKLKEAEESLKRSEEQRTEAKGETMLVRVELEAAKAKLTDLTNALQDERESRHRLEEKYEAKLAEVADLQNKVTESSFSAKETEKTLATERERMRVLFNDEQTKSEVLVDSMREEMLRELRKREEARKEDVLRANDESFTKGIDHGRDMALTEMRLKYESEARDLKLAKTRLTANLDSAKAELALEKMTNKATIERLCYPDTEQEKKEVSALQQHIDALQGQIEEAYARVTTVQADLKEKEDLLDSSDQKLRDTETKCTAAVVALSRQVVPKEHLVRVLQQIFDGETPDTQFTIEEPALAIPAALEPQPALERIATPPAPPAPEPVQVAPVVEAVPPPPPPAAAAAQSAVPSQASGSDPTPAPAGEGEAASPKTVVILPFPVGSAVEALYEDGSWYDASVADTDEQLNSPEGKCAVVWAADGTHATVLVENVREKKEKKKDKSKEKEKKAKEKQKEKEREEKEREKEEKAREKKDKKDKKEKKKKAESEEEAPKDAAKGKAPKSATASALKSMQKPTIFTDTDSEEDDLLLRALQRRKDAGK